MFMSFHLQAFHHVLVILSTGISLCTCHFVYTDFDMYVSFCLQTFHVHVILSNTIQAQVILPTTITLYVISIGISYSCRFIYRHIMKVDRNAVDKINVYKVILYTLCADEMKYLSDHCYAECC
jgi:hypothetical protein